MAAEHTAKAFDTDIDQLRSNVLKMGGLVERQVARAVDGIRLMDLGLVAAVLQDEEVVNRLHVQTDLMCNQVIARRQPIAVDLRMVVTAIQVANDLERTGDMAKQLAKRTLQIDSLALAPKFYNGVKHMTDLVARQLQASLDAYASRDSAKAVAVCAHDDEVDAMHTSLFRELLTYMMEDPRNISQCIHLLFCTKSLERVGDHATNIAEAAYYLETGRQLSQDETNRQQG